MENDNTKILAEFKAKIDKVPIAERGRALAIYNTLCKWIKEDDASDEACKNNLKTFEDAQVKITTKSDEVIEGKRKAVEEELEICKEFLNEGEEIKDEDNDSKTIPDYWLTCFKNKGIYINEDDEAILKHITHLDIQQQNSEKKEGENQKDGVSTTTLILNFSDNEYFTNKELKLTLEYRHEEPEKSTGTEIAWNEGKNPSEKLVTKKQKSKKTGKTRTVEKKEPQRSFFDIFTTCSAEGADIDPEEAINDLDKMNVWEAADTLDSIMEVGPYSLEYYLDCHEADEIGDSDDEDFDGDDEDDEDQDDEDEEEDTPAKKNRRKPSDHKRGKKGGMAHKKSSGNVDGAEGGDPKDQECKQN